MDILSEIGIEQWRLRADFTPAQDADNTALSSSDLQAVAPQETNDSSEVSAATLAPESPVEISEAVSHKESHTDADEPLVEEVADVVIGSEAIDPIATLQREDLQKWISTRQNCPSCGSGRSVLGEGAEAAALWFLVDAPNAGATDESLVLNGRQRALFLNMLVALNTSIDAVYITSVFKCCISDELSMDARCNLLLPRQFQLAQPTTVVCFGEFAAQALLRSNASLSSLRGSSHSCLNGITSAVVTHSLADLLRNPALKADTWQDLQLAHRCLNA